MQEKITEQIKISLNAKQNEHKLSYFRKVLNKNNAEIITQILDDAYEISIIDKKSTQEYLNKLLKFKQLKKELEGSIKPSEKNKFLIKLFEQVTGEKIDTDSELKNNLLNKNKTLNEAFIDEMITEFKTKLNKISLDLSDYEQKIQYLQKRLGHDNPEQVIQRIVTEMYDLEKQTQEANKQAVEGCKQYFRLKEAVMKSKASNSDKKKIIQKLCEEVLSEALDVKQKDVLLAEKLAKLVIEKE